MQPLKGEVLSERTNMERFSGHTAHWEKVGCKAVWIVWSHVCEIISESDYPRRRTGWTLLTKKLTILFFGWNYLRDFNFLLYKFLCCLNFPRAYVVFKKQKGKKNRKETTHRLQPPSLCLSHCTSRPPTRTFQVRWCAAWVGGALALGLHPELWELGPAGPWLGGILSEVIF